jgi:uncharacterized protein with GYD domain
MSLDDHRDETTDTGPAEDGRTRREFLDATGTLFLALVGANATGCHTAAGSQTIPDHPRSRTLPLYLTRFNYTSETWARLAKNPEDRRNAAKAYIESVGGKLHGFWYAFGEYDGYTLWEAPSNVAMASVAMALSAGGAMARCDTAPLLSIEETLEALGKVESIRYRQPGK